MAQGRNNAGIAAALGLSERAVEKHINSLFSKLGALGGARRAPPGQGGAALPRRPLRPPGRADGRAGGRVAAPGAASPPVGVVAAPWQARDPDAENGVVSPTRSRVLIVDDQAPFRRAARGGDRPPRPGSRWSARPSSGEEAVELVDALDPGLVLMDINLPGINGIEATRRITAAHPDAVVHPALDLPGRRPARADADACGAAGVRPQGGLRPRRRPRRLGDARPPPDRRHAPDNVHAGSSVSRRAGCGRGCVVPCAGRGVDGDAAADRADPVAHVHEAVARGARRSRGRSRRRRRRPRTAARLRPRAP